LVFLDGALMAIQGALDLIMRYSGGHWQQPDDPIRPRRYHRRRSENGLSDRKVVF